MSLSTYTDSSDLKIQNAFPNNFSVIKMPWPLRNPNTRQLVYSFL